MDVDIVCTVSSPQAHSGLQAANYVQGLRKSLPTLTPLVLILKLVLSAKGLRNTFSGDVAPYALILMLYASIRRSREHRQIDGSGADESTIVVHDLVDFLTLYGRDFDPSTQGSAVSRRCHECANACYALR